MITKGGSKWRKVFPTVKVRNFEEKKWKKEGARIAVKYSHPRRSWVPNGEGEGVAGASWESEWAGAE